MKIQEKRKRENMKKLKRKLMKTYEKKRE